MIDSLGIFAESLLDYVYDHLHCTPLGRPCAKKLAICEPIDPCCDYLSVWVESIFESETISGCEGIVDSAPVAYRLKLVRPCKPVKDCKPTAEYTNAVKNSYADAVALRGALARFANEYLDCNSSWSIGSIVPTCDSETEMCSGWSTVFIVDTELCDDGPCLTVPLIPPVRCVQTSTAPVAQSEEIPESYG